VFSLAKSKDRPMTMPTMQPRNRRSGRSVIPWIFAGGLGLVVAVNAGMAYLAVKTLPGMVTDKPYDKGASYNAVLERAAAQDALGWKAEAHFAPTTPGHGTVIFDLRDSAGAQLTGVTLTARLARPIETLPPVPVTFAEEAGHYAAAIEVPRLGQWDLFILARRGADEFDYSQRLVIR
jgi:nitrogen fixation protein FixH